MTKRSVITLIALSSVPLLVAGAALAQTTGVSDDEDWLTPRERTLAHHPNLYPDWTWISEDQAILLLKAAGFSDVLGLERFGTFWRGKAVANDGAFYHVAVNRYAEVFGHMDRKSLIAAREKERNETTKPVANMLATLNGPIVSSEIAGRSYLRGVTPPGRHCHGRNRVDLVERRTGHRDFECQRLHSRS